MNIFHQQADKMDVDVDKERKIWLLDEKETDLLADEDAQYRVKTIVSVGYSALHKLEMTYDAKARQQRVVAKLGELKVDATEVKARDGVIARTKQIFARQVRIMSRERLEELLWMHIEERLINEHLEDVRKDAEGAKQDAENAAKYAADYAAKISANRAEAASKRSAEIVGKVADFEKVQQDHKRHLQRERSLLSVEVNAKLDAIEKACTEKVQAENKQYEDMLMNIKKGKSDMSVEVELDFLAQHNDRIWRLRADMMLAQIELIQAAKQKEKEEP